MRRLTTIVAAAVLTTGCSSEARTAEEHHGVPDTAEVAAAPASPNPNQYGSDFDTDFEREYRVNLFGEFSTEEIEIVRSVFEDVVQIADYRSNQYINIGLIKGKLSRRAEEIDSIRADRQEGIEARNRLNQTIARITGDTVETGPTPCDRALDEQLDDHLMGFAINDYPENGYDILAIDDINQIEDYIGGNYRKGLIHEILGHLLTGDPSIPEEHKQWLYEKFREINSRAEGIDEETGRLRGYASAYANQEEFVGREKGLTQQCYDYLKSDIEEGIEEERTSMQESYERLMELRNQKPEDERELRRWTWEAEMELQRHEMSGEAIERYESRLARIDAFFEPLIGNLGEKIETQRVSPREDIAETAWTLIDNMYPNDHFLQEKKGALVEFFARAYPTNSP